MASQLCLQRIMQIITSYPSQDPPKDQSLSYQIEENSEKRGLGIDLNVGLREEEEEEEEEEEVNSAISACSVVDKVSPEGSSTVVFYGDLKSSEGECDDPHAQPTKMEDDGLCLLVKAAEMVSNEEDRTAKDGSMVGSSVLRTKRERCKAMPSRYRDDSVVLEPWKPLPRSQRSLSRIRKKNI